MRVMEETSPFLKASVNYVVYKKKKTELYICIYRELCRARSCI